MKIAVLNCPRGISAEGVLQALSDAGLSRAYLQKELKRRRADKKSKELTVRMLKALEGASLRISEEARLMKLAGVAIGMRYFEIEKCFVRNVAIGRRGNPRVLKLLKGFVLERLPLNQELVTADGAAILAALCEKEISIPAMRLETVGFASDSLQLSIGETVTPYRRERILMLETNIDDMSPLGFELLYERLFEAGALDVWVQPILMKKMRPAFKLSVLIRHWDQDKISNLLFKETPTLGVRFLELDRFSLPRKTFRVRTRFGRVRFKGGWLDSQPLKVSPEYDDLKEISRRRRLSFFQVYETCMKDWKRQGQKT